MEFKDLIGKKVLIKKRGEDRILEVRVIRVSPSGRYAEVGTGLYNTWWIDTYEYMILEVLE